MNRIYRSVTVLLLLLSVELANAEPYVEIVIGDTTPKQVGKGKFEPGKLNNPFAVDFDANENMYIVEYQGGRIHRMTPDGKLTHVAGRPDAKGYTGDGGPPKQATFNLLHNLAIAPDGKLYMSDHLNSVVRTFDPKTNAIASYAGNGKKGFAGDDESVTKARFNMVMCVMLNPAKDTLYIADIRNYRIRAINMKSQTISTVAGNGKRGIPKDAAISTKAPLVDPRAAAADKKGNLYIVERGGHALRVVRTDGKIYTLAGTGKKGKADGSALKATMNGPKHLDIDDDGNVYIADDNNHLIRKYDPKSKTLTTVLGKGKTKLNRPHGVCVHKGYLYVADSWHHRILKIKL